MTGELLNPNDVAQQLSISATTVRSLCDSGELAHFRIGPKRLYRIAPQVVEDYKRRCQPRPAVKAEKSRRRQFGPGLDFIRSLGYDG